MGKISPEDLLRQILVPATQAFLDTHFADFQADCAPGSVLTLPCDEDMFYYVHVTLPAEKILSQLLLQLYYRKPELLDYLVKIVREKTGVTFETVGLSVHWVRCTKEPGDQIYIQFWGKSDEVQ